MVPKKRERCLISLAALAIGLCASAKGLHAEPSRISINPQAHHCDYAARQASQESGVPLDILYAVTRTETGRTKNGETQPWPWTVNMEGRGVWFDTKAAALEFVFDHFKTGARSFDVGCFQINYRWHGAMFSSIEQMFDPVPNARYAASFLLQLHSETGSWTSAVGAFHSRTPALADKYLVRFKAQLDATERSENNAGAFPVKTRHARPNRFPLLQAGRHSSLGSLVPLADIGATTPVIPLRSGPDS